ncbi:hypothetical protein D3C81_1762830 [compost metagenome]
MADNPAQQKIGAELSSLLNFIPSAYYDLITRACREMAFWGALYEMSFLINYSSDKS